MANNTEDIENNMVSIPECVTAKLTLLSARAVLVQDQQMGCFYAQPVVSVLTWRLHVDDTTLGWHKSQVIV